jgi:hypothetical protein
MAGSGRAGGPPLSSAGVAEAKALALGLEDVAAVREAVEGGYGLAASGVVAVPEPAADWLLAAATMAAARRSFRSRSTSYTAPT